ncbi:MAG: response regulator [Clostridiales bacterium]|jgi:two-component system response regulator YesN|nr:response regulator [Clostridiales bacterium]
MYQYIVVDDERLVRKGTIAKLKGMEDKLVCIGEADNGQAALDLIESLSPQIVVTDMNMPVMDGLLLLPQIMEKHPDMQLVVISGYRDFEYAKQAVMAKAVDYLLKPFSSESLQAAMGKAIDALNKNLKSSDFINSSDMEASRFKYDLQALQSSLLPGGSPVFEFVSKRLQLVSKKREFSLITIVTGHPLDSRIYDDFLQLGGVGDLALHLVHPASRCAEEMLLFTPSNSVLSHKNLSMQVVANLENYLRTECNGVSQIIGVSEPHSDIGQFREAYEQTVQAMNQHQIKDNKTIYAYIKGTPKPYPFAWSKEQELLFRIEAGMQAEAMQLTNELFEDLARLPGCRMLDIKAYCSYLSDQIRTILHDYFARRESGFSSNSMQTAWDTIFDADAFRAHFSVFIGNIVAALKDDSVYAKGDTVEKMKVYVQRNYMKKLSIELLADLFYLNRSYCSYLFKKQTGTKFVDYVNIARIDKAKELLAISSKKMYQISKAVGYENPKYFFRVFKNLVGVTPDQYRARMEEEGKET